MGEVECTFAPNSSTAAAGLLPNFCNYTTLCHGVSYNGPGLTLCIWANLEERAMTVPHIRHLESAEAVNGIPWTGLNDYVFGN